MTGSRSRAFSKERGKLDSGDGKNICIEVNVVIKPNRHTLEDD